MCPASSALRLPPATCTCPFALPSAQPPFHLSHHQPPPCPLAPLPTYTPLTTSPLLTDEVFLWPDMREPMIAKYNESEQNKRRREDDMRSGPQYVSLEPPPPGCDPGATTGGGCGGEVAALLTLLPCAAARAVPAQSRLASSSRLPGSTGMPK